MIEVKEKEMTEEMVHITAKIKGGKWIRISFTPEVEDIAISISGRTIVEYYQSTIPSFEEQTISGDEEKADTEAADANPASNNEETTSDKPLDDNVELSDVEKEDNTANVVNEAEEGSAENSENPTIKEVTEHDNEVAEEEMAGNNEELTDAEITEEPQSDDVTTGIDSVEDSNEAAEEADTNPASNNEKITGDKPSDVNVEPSDVEEEDNTANVAEGAVEGTVENSENSTTEEVREHDNEATEDKMAGNSEESTDAEITEEPESDEVTTGIDSVEDSNEVAEEADTNPASHNEKITGDEPSDVNVEVLDVEEEDNTANVAVGTVEGTVENSENSTTEEVREHDNEIVEEEDNTANVAEKAEEESADNSGNPTKNVTGSSEVAEEPTYAKPVRNNEESTDVEGTDEDSISPGDAVEEVTDENDENWVKDFSVPTYNPINQEEGGTESNTEKVNKNDSKTEESANDEEVSEKIPNTTGAGIKTENGKESKNPSNVGKNIYNPYSRPPKKGGLFSGLINKAAEYVNNWITHK